MTNTPATATANAATADAGREYAYCVRDETVDRTIVFVEVDPALDVDRLHAWFGSDHVKSYWQLGLPKPAFRAKLDEKLADDHLTPYVGLLDHIPMSYWEAHRAADDVVATCYGATPEDRSAHLLVEPPEYLGHGHSIPLLRAMTAFQFRATGATRVVNEPDVRNERVIHVFERCGYKPQGRIDLPDEEVLLIYCERDRFSDTVAENTEMEMGR